MNAPIITMPRNTDSPDALEVDLGTLKLTNRIAWLGSGGISDRKVHTAYTAHCPPVRLTHTMLQYGFIPNFVMFFTSLRHRSGYDWENTSTYSGGNF